MSSRRHNLLRGNHFVYVLSLLVYAIVYIFFYVRILVLSPFFILDQQLNPFAAIKAFFLATRGVWWRLFFGLIALMAATLGFSAFTLGVGFVWAFRPF